MTMECTYDECAPQARKTKTGEECSGGQRLNEKIAFGLRSESGTQLGTVMSKLHTCDHMFKARVIGSK